MIAALLDWRDDRSRRGGDDRPCRGPRLLRRRRRGDARPQRRRRRKRGARLLLRGISPQPPAVHLRQADHRLHGRDHHGRRRRHLAALPLPGRDREYALRHAGDGDRPVPRRRRRLVPVAPAGPRRPVHGADRRALDGAECLYLGLATHYVPSLALDELKARIASRAAADRGAARANRRRPAEPRIAGNLERIDRLFASDRL
jgi:hypothetical protein